MAMQNHECGQFLAKLLIGSMAKDLSELKWIEELLPKDVLRKAFFGGFGYYVEDRIVLAAFESPSERTYKNTTYDFDLWNGCLFPVDFEHHQEIEKRFPYLITHPVLKKWKYLPSDSENFDYLLEPILKEIRRRSKLFGTVPNSKKRPSKDTGFKNIDTRKPRMFSDEPIEVKLQSAKRISDLKNLGPATENQFLKAGIKSVSQFVKLGWKKSLQKLVKIDPKNRHSIFAYAMIGALQNKEWNAISESDKMEARNFTASLKPVKKAKAKAKAKAKRRN